jgi:hypothetical protein
MTRSQKKEQVWVRVAGITGVASVLSYFGAAFVPLPDAVARLLAFAFGPLLVASFLGFYRFMSRHRNGPVLQTACLFGAIAGTMVTCMLVVQVGNNMVRADLLQTAESEAARQAAEVSWRAVNRVQYLLDVVWDIFICCALILLGMAMLGHPRYGKVWGGLGILAAALLLALNLQTFPEAPAYAGSIDLGPLVALWMLAVFLRTLFIKEASES